MSNDKTSFKPHSADIMRDKIAPPAGPDSTRRIGRFCAVSNVVMPPLDIIMSNGAEYPVDFRDSPKFLRYVCINGRI